MTDARAPGPKSPAVTSIGPRGAGIAAALVACCATTLIAAAPARAESRGELLYANHCVECHTRQMHWRDRSVVSNWASLRYQVRRWQGNAGLAWSEADIDEVARYLNEAIYRLPPSSAPRSSAAPPARSSG